jgi:hypothetical protein
MLFYICGCGLPPTRRDLHSLVAAVFHLDGVVYKEEFREIHL